MGVGTRETVAPAEVLRSFRLGFAPASATTLAEEFAGEDRPAAFCDVWVPTGGGFRAAVVSRPRPRAGPSRASGVPEIADPAGVVALPLSAAAKPGTDASIPPTPNATARAPTRPGNQLWIIAVPNPLPPPHAHLTLAPLSLGQRHVLTGFSLVFSGPEDL